MPGHDEPYLAAPHATDSRRYSANCLAGRGSALKLRAQIVSFRLAQESRILIIMIGIERAQRLAAVSGMTATPTSAATIWQIAWKSRIRARNRRRAPNRAACFEIWTCSAVEAVSPTKSRA